MFCFQAHFDILDCAAVPRYETMLDLMTGITHTELSAVALCVDTTERYCFGVCISEWDSCRNS